MNEKWKDQDVLLVQDNNNDELKAVSGIDRNGKLKIVEAKAENASQFLLIDRTGNDLENFMSKFKRQEMNPIQFKLFKVRYGKFEKLKEGLEELLFRPHLPENKEMLRNYEVNPKDFSAKQPAHAIDENLVDWSQFERIGITRESLEKSGDLEKLLNWQKTDLLPISVKFEDISIRTDARLALRELPDGKLSLSVHAIHQKPDLNKPYFGVKFTDEDRENLLKTGHLGRKVDVEYQKGVTTSVLVSIDPLTKELVAFRADRIKIPDNIKEVVLTAQQKKDLSEGKAVYLKNMMSKKSTRFNAYVQFNADKKGLEFRSDNDRHKTQVAVNSEGKTNETTKNVNQPLDKGQTQPAAKQAEEQEQKEQKKKGVKM